MDTAQWNHLIIQHSGCLTLLGSRERSAPATEFYISLFMWTFIPREVTFLFQRSFLIITRIITASICFMLNICKNTCTYIILFVITTRWIRRSIRKDSYAGQLGIQATELDRLRFKSGSAMSFITLGRSPKGCRPVSSSIIWE